MSATAFLTATTVIRETVVKHAGSGTGTAIVLAALAAAVAVACVIYLVTATRGGLRPHPTPPEEGS